MSSNFFESPVDETECPDCGGINPEELSAGTLDPSACRCGYFRGR